MPLKKSNTFVDKPQSTLRLQIRTECARNKCPRENVRAFGKLVRELRKKAGKTQCDLARDVGVSKSRMHQIEISLGTPATEKHIRAIAKALGVGVGVLRAASVQDANARSLHKRNMILLTCARRLADTADLVINEIGLRRITKGDSEVEEFVSLAKEMRAGFLGWADDMGKRCGAVEGK